MVAADAAGADQVWPDSADSSSAADPANQSSRSAALRQRLRQGAGRLSWGLADQAVSSLTNSAMSIYIARELGAVPFGAFSLAYVTYSFALNASRGLATDPLTVRFSGADLPVWRRAVARLAPQTDSLRLLAESLAAAARDDLVDAAGGHRTAVVHPEPQLRPV